jgi:hypothetical protein
MISIFQKYLKIYCTDETRISIKKEQAEKWKINFYNQDEKLITQLKQGK